MRYLFEECLLDTDRHELRRGTDLVAIEPQVFDLLVHLIQHRDRVVSKDELLASVWHGRAISESALFNRINAARSAIGDTGERQRLIKTLPRRGLRFVGAVREEECSLAEARPDKPSLGIADKPSIAVLPFVNLSGDPEQDYFIDGIVEDIITALSRNRGFLRHRPQLVIHLQGKTGRHQAGRARTRRPLRIGRQRTQVGQSRARDRTVDRSRVWPAFVGRPV